MTHIFISYSHTDSEYAQRLAEQLIAEGFEVWIDHRIDYGTQWPTVIQQNLDSCAAFIVIMSPRAAESQWVQNELNRAMRKKKPLFPLLLEGDEPWLAVETIQFTNVVGGKLPDPRFYKTIAKALPHKKSYTEERLAAMKVTLPLLDWVSIHRGRVTVEGKPETVTDYRLSKYPVTNAQFQAFIEAGRSGYTGKRSWQFSPAALRWHEEHPEPQAVEFSGDDLPRTNVSWYEAMAFCEWLTHQLKQRVLLPTEQQWQYAAQSSKNWEYPWGMEFDSERCNTAESGLKRVMPVNHHPAGASRYGVQDMAGNVWEWCLTNWQNGTNTDTTSTGLRVLKGGSWRHSYGFARTTFRDSRRPHVRENALGFRLAITEL